MTGSPPAGGGVDEWDRVRAADAAFLESVLDAIPDVVYAFDRRGRFLRWNERVTEVTGYTDEEMAELDVLEFVPEDDREHVARLIDCVFTDRTVESVESRLVTKDGREIPYEFTGAPIVADGEVVGLTGVGRDVTERKRRESTLERLDELNTVIRSVDRALVEADTREEITRAVCEGLVDEGAYAGAVVGTAEFDGGFAVESIAGVDRTAVDALAGAETHGSRSLAATAADDCRVAVLEAIESDGPARWRADALAQGYSAVAAVPLVAADQDFGVLSVFADHDEFAERERTVLAELGQSVASAVRSALARELLYADVVTEIELVSRDRDALLVDVSAAAECRLELQRVVTFGDEQVFFVRASATALDRIRDVVSARPAVIDATEIDGADDGQVIEFRTRGETIPSILSDNGARTTTGEADRGSTKVVAELPPGGDVREVVAAVTDRFPETQLVARRTVDQAPETPVEFRHCLDEALTDKQRAALEAAYFSGYFEWPVRSSTAEDVAETLDIATQTFHQHLRVAQRKLLRDVFDARNDNEP